MDYVLYVAFIGLITGILGTLSGSLFVLLVRKIDDKFLTFVLGISAGIMVVVVFLDLIPEALKVGSIWSTLLGMLLGVTLIALLDYVFLHQHFIVGNSKYLKAGFLLVLGIAFHNIPEGLAIGAGYSSTSSLGTGLAIIIGLQNFPEGMAIATILCLAGLKNLQVIIITIASGIPMGIGAFWGAYLGSVSDYFLSISLGFAAGAMLYITFDELIPGAQENKKGHIALLGILLGVFLGIILTNRF